MSSKTIAQLLNSTVNIEKLMGCTTGEWVQVLMQNIDNDNWFMRCNTTSAGRVNGYIVAINNVHPPIFDSVNILLFVSSGEFKINIAIRDELNKWAKEKQAKCIIFACKNVDTFVKYGANKTAELGRWEL
jgi:hypothetical protein